MATNSSIQTKMAAPSKENLVSLYNSGLSMLEIANKIDCNHHAIIYWMNKFHIPRRSQSDATYCKRNPGGDPFSIKVKLDRKDTKLMGLGIGLYWGEGHKKSLNSVRLGNSDPALIESFRNFLLKICGANPEKIKYNLLLFNDVRKNEAIQFWEKQIDLAPKQISVTLLKTRGKGTYRNKSTTGVMIIEVHNKKLKMWLDDQVKNIQY